MPALTIAAACRYAETGVMATIESGSHAWNGNWADLVNTAPARSSATGMANPGWAQESETRTSVMRVVPVPTHMTTTAARRLRPPAAVTRRVRIAGSRASLPDRAMRKNEQRVVASQATNISTRSSARTRSSIAAAKPVINTKKDAFGPLGRYRAE